jgi:hypothetical protein
MNCQAPGCEKDLNWFRIKLLKKPGFYLDASWYCSAECLAEGLTQRVRKLRRTPEKTVQNLLRIKLGHILLEQGIINGDQLEKAMAEKNAHNDVKFGQCLLAMGFVKERDITMALSRQYGLPVINLKADKTDPVLLSLIPPQIIRDAGFFPLEFDGINNTLLLVTCDPGDVSAIINLRSMLNCEASIYLSDESVVTERIVHFCALIANDGISVEEVSFPEFTEAPDHLAAYLAQRCDDLDARSLNFRFFGQRLWARFISENHPVDLIINLAESP